MRWDGSIVPERENIPVPSRVPAPVSIRLLSAEGSAGQPFTQGQNTRSQAL
jgi:hypothetical protein